MLPDNGQDAFRICIELFQAVCRMYKGYYGKYHALVTGGEIVKVFLAVGSVLLLRDRPKTEPEPEARAEPEAEAPEMAETPEEKRWREELEALWNYDGRGGAMSGDKENTGRDL